MPPGALKKYLQFPKPPEEDDDDPVTARALYQARKIDKNGYDAELENALRQAKAIQKPDKASSAMQGVIDSADDDKQSAAAQQEPSITSRPMQGMAQPAGVPTPSASKSPGSFDDEIQTQLNAYKTTMGDRPQRPTGPIPQMAQLPPRPQASPWEAIPQILAGAGNVLSAGSNHPQDYLTPLMAGQKAKRDEAYGDQLAQIHNNFQNEMAAYTDKTQKYSMDLRDHEQRLHDLKSHIDMLTEQKYLGKSPQDTAYQAQLDWARGLYKDTQNPQDIKNLAERLSKQFPEKAKALQEAAQEAMGVNQVGFDQTKAGMKRFAGMVSPTAGVQQGVENMTVPSGQGFMGRTPVIGAPRGYRAAYASPAFMVPAALDAIEAAGGADFSGGPKYGGTPVHLPPMTEEEQKKYMDEKGKKKSSLKKQMEEQQAAQYQQRFQIPLGH